MKKFKKPALFLFPLLVFSSLGLSACGRRNEVNQQDAAAGTPTAPEATSDTMATTSPSTLAGATTTTLP